MAVVPVVIDVLIILKFLILVAIFVIFTIIVCDSHCLRQPEEAPGISDKATKGGQRPEEEV